MALFFLVQILGIFQYKTIIRNLACTGQISFYPLENKVL